LIDWDDGTNGSWLGPYDSGLSVAASYVWDEQEDYTIRVKAVDVRGFESNWSTLEVSMPKNKQPAPKCNTKWIFFCNINTSGFVDTAYNFLQGKYIGVMYYGYSQGDFGKVVVNKVINRFDSNHVYSVFVYGFKGKTSWNGSIRESNIWIDGFAFAVCIKY